MLVVSHFVYILTILLFYLQTIQTVNSVSQLKQKQETVTQDDLIRINKQYNKQAVQENCTQKFSRLFFTESENKLFIKFNTIDRCSRSYVTIIQNNSISKFYCTSQQLKIQQQTLYLRYIQNCLITINKDYDTFNYTLYGQSINTFQEDKKLKQSETYTVNIRKADKSLNIIVTADWGPMKVRPYQPIYPSLTQQIRQNKNNIHAMMIIGDVAYDLASNQCLQYELFMKQLSTVSPYIPIIPILGNHESATKENFQIFKLTFECYNLSAQARLQTYNFYNLKIITFDPYLQIYGKSTAEQYSMLRQNLLNQLKTEGKFVILSSHYPVICSQQVFHCRRTLEILPQLYKEISKLNQVDLYLGAHMHQYERIVSYRDGEFNLGRRGQYGKGEMPSIVEGVAGCDVGIIDTDYQVQKFSVSHSYNQTGYGILKIGNLKSSPFGQYIHYSTLSSNQIKIFDEVFINTANIIDNQTKNLRLMQM